MWCMGASEFPRGDSFQVLWIVLLLFLLVCKNYLIQIVVIGVKARNPAVPYLVGASSLTDL